MTIQGQVSAYGSVFSNNQIDLTNYSTAEITITAIDTVNYGGSVRIGFTKSKSVNYTGTYGTASVGTLKINISSLTGNYYLASSFTGETKVTISKIVLIP